MLLAILAERVSVTGIFELIALLFFAVTAFIIATFHFPWIYAGLLSFVMGLHFHRKAKALRALKKMAQQDPGGGWIVPRMGDIRFNEYSSRFSMGIGGVVIALALWNIIPFTILNLEGKQPVDPNLFTEQQFETFKEYVSSNDVAVVKEDRWAAEARAARDGPEAIQWKKIVAFMDLADEIDAAHKKDLPDQLFRHLP